MEIVEFEAVFVVLTDLCSVASTGEVLLADSLFDAVDLVLVSFAIAHRTLLGLLFDNKKLVRKTKANLK